MSDDEAMKRLEARQKARRDARERAIQARIQENNSKYTPTPEAGNTGSREGSGVGLKIVENVAPPSSENTDLAILVVRGRTKLLLWEIGCHSLVLIASLASIWLVHLVLGWLLGHGAVFLSSIPIRWVIDLADLVVIIKFIWGIVKDFKEKESKQ